MRGFGKASLVLHVHGGTKNRISKCRPKPKNTGRTTFGCASRRLNHFGWQSGPVNADCHNPGFYQSRRAVADSSGWERDEVPVLTVIDDSTPRCADPMSPQIGIPTADGDWKDLMSILKAYYPKWEDAKWQLRRVARTTPDQVGSAILRIFVPPSTAMDPNWMRLI